MFTGGLWLKIIMQRKINITWLDADTTSSRVTIKVKVLDEHKLVCEALEFAFGRPLTTYEVEIVRRNSINKPQLEDGKTDL